MSKKPTMASQLASANAEVARLEEKVAELEAEFGVSEDDDRIAASFLRDQIDTLATDTDSVSAPKTPEQWRRCLQGILRGEDWRNGTWK